MKNRRKITSLISLLSLVVFLTASTGISVITYSCLYSCDESLTTGFLTGENADSQSCCLTECCYSEQVQTAEEFNDCCKIEINLFKVTYFIPEVLRVLRPDLIILPYNLSSSAPVVLEENTTSPFAGSEKYGGISIIKFHRQLII